MEKIIIKTIIKIININKTMITIEIMEEIDQEIIIKEIDLTIIHSKKELEENLVRKIKELILESC
jgi:hypothetical protein